MDKLTLYLEVVPIPLILGVGFFMGMVYLIMPANLRFYATFLIMPAWLVASRSPDLGPMQAFTKISSGLLFLLIALAAAMRPVPKREIPGIAWIYMIGGLYLMLCLIGVQNTMDELVIQFQWLMLVAAALATVATLTTIDDIEKLIKVLTWGMILALCIPMSAVVMNPGELFGKLGRFTPWSAEPNLIGIAFLMAAPLLLYAIMTTKSNTYKLFLIAALMGDIGMALVTGSRQVVFSLAAAMGLMCLPLIKRPGLVITGAVLGILVIPFFWGLNQDAVGRLGSLDTSGRLSLWWEYFLLSFKQPLGLLGTSGQNAHYSMAVGAGAHPHNVFFEMLYVGGWPYLIAMLTVIVTGLRSAWRVWKVRYMYGTRNQQFMIHMLVSILIAMYLQGMSNQVIFHPTYAWSFLCVVLTVLFIALEREMPYVEEEYLLQFQDWDEEYEEDLNDYPEALPA